MARDAEGRRRVDGPPRLRPRTEPANCSIALSRETQELLRAFKAYGDVTLVPSHLSKAGTVGAAATVAATTSRSPERAKRALVRQVLAEVPRSHRESDQQLRASYVDGRRQSTVHNWQAGVRTPRVHHWSPMQAFTLRWIQQGETNWEPWWVQAHGHSKTHVPGQMEHISFANHDLRMAGLPEIKVHAGSITIETADLPRVQPVLDRHGFVVVDEGW